MDAFWIRNFFWQLIGFHGVSVCLWLGVMGTCNVAQGQELLLLQSTPIRQLAPVVIEKSILSGQSADSEGTVKGWVHVPVGKGFTLRLPISLLETSNLAPGSSTSRRFRFQWVKDGKILRGATASTLMVERSSTSSTGVYSLQIISPDGQALSSAETRVSVLNPFLKIGGVERSVQAAFPVFLAGSKAAREATLTLTLTSGGAGSAVLKVEGVSQRFRVQFDSDWRANISLPEDFASRNIQLAVLYSDPDALPSLGITVDGEGVSAIRWGVSASEVLVGHRYTGAFEDIRENLQNGNVFGYFAASTDSKGSRLLVKGRLPSGKVLLHSSLLWRAFDQTSANFSTSVQGGIAELVFDLTDKSKLTGTINLVPRDSEIAASSVSHRIFGAPYSGAVLAGIGTGSDVFEIAAPPHGDAVWEVAGQFLIQPNQNRLSGTPRGETLRRGGLILDRLTGLFSGLCTFSESNGVGIERRTRSFSGVVFKIEEADRERLHYSQPFKGVGMTSLGVPMQINPLLASESLRTVGEMLQSTSMEVGGNTPTFGSVLLIGNGNASLSSGVSILSGSLSVVSNSGMSVMSGSVALQSSGALILTANSLSTGTLVVGSGITQTGQLSIGAGNVVLGSEGSLRGGTAVLTLPSRTLGF